MKRYIILIVASATILLVSAFAGTTALATDNHCGPDQVQTTSPNFPHPRPTSWTQPDDGAYVIKVTNGTDTTHVPNGDAVFHPAGTVHTAPAGYVIVHTDRCDWDQPPTTIPTTTIGAPPSSLQPPPDTTSDTSTTVTPSSTPATSPEPPAKPGTSVSPQPTQSTVIVDPGTPPTTPDAERGPTYCWTPVLDSDGLPIDYVPCTETTVADPLVQRLPSTGSDLTSSLAVAAGVFVAAGLVLLAIKRRPS